MKVEVDVLGSSFLIVRTVSACGRKAAFEEKEELHACKVLEVCLSDSAVSGGKWTPGNSGQKP